MKGPQAVLLIVMMANVSLGVPYYGRKITKRIGSWYPAGLLKYSPTVRLGFQRYPYLTNGQFLSGRNIKGGRGYDYGKLYRLYYGKMLGRPIRGYGYGNALNGYDYSRMLAGYGYGYGYNTPTGSFGYNPMLGGLGFGNVMGGQFGNSGFVGFRGFNRDSD